MFTKIVMRNIGLYRLTVDGTDAQVANDYPVIYGYKDSDKVNLIAAFQLLDDLLNTMNVRREYEEFLSEGFVFRNKKKTSQQKGLRDMQSILRDYSRTDPGKPMSVLYEFSIGDNTGSYFVELGETEIAREKLVYKQGEEESVYFDFQKESILIDPRIITNKYFLADICSMAVKFWGKHSMLAIINYEISDKAEAYGKDSFINELKDVFEELSILSGQLSIGITGIDELHKQFEMHCYPDENLICFEFEEI